MYAFKDRETRKLNSDECDEITKFYFEDKYNCDNISRLLHIHVDNVREVIRK